MKKQQLVDQLQIIDKMNEDDHGVQELYFNYLNRIIDSCIMLRYNYDKKNKLAFTLDQVNDLIIKYFKKIEPGSEEYVFMSIANKLYYMTDRKDEIPYYCQKLKIIYENYVSGIKNDTDTTNFYNEILNKQQNAYLSKKRVQEIEKIIINLSLTSKKQQSLLNGIKFPIILELIKKGDYKKLHTTEQIFKIEMENAKLSLSKKRKLNNIYMLQEEDYQYLDSLFLSNQLTESNITGNFPFYNKRQIKSIINAYYRVLLPYLREIDDNQKIIGKETARFNSNDFKIYSRKRTKENVKKFETVLKSTSKQIKNSSYFNELVKLLPLVNIIKEFDMSAFLCIMFNFPKIKDNLVEKGKLKDNVTVEEILNCLPNIIELGKAYASAESFTMEILGEDTICKILSDNLTSCNPDRYLKVYIDMLNSYTTSIPPISGVFGEYQYESGNYKKDRLLIGKNCYNSCIGLSGAGEEAYKQALYSEDADVLIIKKKDTKEFVARTLMFRRGNFIVLAPIQGQKGVVDKLYNVEFLRKICDDIMETQKLNHDNLKYVLLTSAYSNIELPFRNISRDIISADIPHCDIDQYAYLLNNCKKEIKLNSDIKVKPKYLKNREPIKKKSSDYLEDIKRIKTLEKISKNEHFSIQFNNVEEIYDEVYIGQDFYMAIKDGDIVSKGIYKVDDPRQQIEISAVIDSVLEQNEGPFINDAKLMCKK